MIGSREPLKKFTKAIMYIHSKPIQKIYSERQPQRYEVTLVFNINSLSDL